MEDFRDDLIEAAATMARFGANTRKSVSWLKTPAEIRKRGSLLDDYWRAYRTAWRSYCKAVKAEEVDEFTSDDYDTIEEAYVTAGGELEAMLEAATGGPIAAAALGAVGQDGGGQPGGFRMKAIEVPKFTGEIDDWVGFRDLFSSIVINNTLSNVHRLQHLRMACEGKAAELIGGIDVTAANFVVAWDALKQRYENERLLVFRLIERLINLPAMTRECSTELARLIDGTNQTVRSLAVLKRKTEHWDDLLVVQTTLKLDFNTRVAWEKSINTTTDMPTFKELDVFLNGALRSAEAVKDLNGGENQQSSFNNGQRSVRTHVTATTDNKKACAMCNGPHGLYKCTQFINKPVTERRDFIETNRICYNCINTKEHFSSNCPIKYHCGVCKRHHHTLLHRYVEQAEIQGSQSAPNEPRTNPFAQPSVSSNVCQFEPANKSNVILPTAWITVTAYNGRSLKLRALIDPGSHTSIVSEQAVQRLGVARVSTDLIISGVGHSSAGNTSGCVRFTVSAFDERKENVVVKVEAYVLPTVTSDLPMRPLMKSTHPDFAELVLADNQYGRPGRIDVLLGSDVTYDVILAGVRKADGFLAQNSVFGWLMSGDTGRCMLPASSVMTFHVQLDGLLQRFWEQEETHQRPVMSIEDTLCEKTYHETTTRGIDGRYVLELPFRQGGRELGESRTGAIRRLLQMEKKGAQYPNMYEGYKKFMAIYLQLQHMEEIAANEIDAEPHCYLPHHAVFKPDSTTTKLRVVFDATAATSNGKGLNEYMLTGPRLQETLAEILMRWRKHKIAVSADIEKMYRQIWVSPKHCNYQRIVWRNGPDDDIKHYRLKTVTYGTASAPYMAVKTLQRLADDEEASFPLAAAVVRNDFYVDDCMSGADTLTEADQLKDELLQIMQAGGMRLMKWSSNCKELLQKLPNEYIECHAPLEIDDDGSVKALGVHWHPATDEFTYKVYVSEEKEASSKRQVLSEIAKLFDPLGLLAPVIITAKIMMQRLWLTGLGWDDVLPVDVRERWRTYQHELVQLEQIRVKRWCGFGKGATMQLHGFSDASELAYAACVYARVLHENGTVIVTLLAAKTKVAPIKQQTIPRLELNDAVLVARLLNECRKALKCGEMETFAWTDSTVVLAWLSRHANIRPTFVANRVSEIQGTMQSTVWQHVPGVQNPADVASRGIMPHEMNGHHLWWSGPDWLRAGREMWPQQHHLEVDAALLEKKKSVTCHVALVKKMWDLTERFSSWTRLLRITAYCRRVLQVNRPTDRALYAEEIDAARCVWYRLIQAHEFGDVNDVVNNRTRLRRCGLMKLGPFVDAQGVLRVGGRLHNAQLCYDEQHPVILPGKNHVTQMIIRDAHERVFHAGPQSTLCQLHQRHWIVNGRRQVRIIIHKCVTCVRSRPRAQAQLMGDLPAARVRQMRPFLHTGVDYAGPIWSRTSKGRGHKATKSWIGVFVCLSTKAIHLELVSDVTAAALIAAFRRFTSRRGICSDVYCDNGTNFVGADQEMRQQLAKCMQDDEWRQILSNSGTRFHFAPPGSPHFNGLAEASVKMAKSAMRKVIGKNKLTFEEMATFLAQVEAALNSRPLCVLQTDGTDVNTLTPGHLLTGAPLTAVPEPNVLDEKLSVSNRWHLVQQLSQHFWARWSREYLHQLQQRQKWSTTADNLIVGDVVIVHDEMLHSTLWKLGHVIETHPGQDGRGKCGNSANSNCCVETGSCEAECVAHWKNVNTSHNHTFEIEHYHLHYHLLH